MLILRSLRNHAHWKHFLIVSLYKGKYFTRMSSLTMELLKLIRVYLVIVTMVAGRKMMSDEDIRHIGNEHTKLLRKDTSDGPIMCARLAKEPYFGVELLLGRAWRIYYAWNMDLQNQCMDMIFRNVTPAIVNRFYNDMGEYLETEPYWDAATVKVSMGRSKHEMLLFADQGAAGRFQGVPNIVRDGNITPMKASVPLLNFHLKLMYGGKYLLMADCQIGVTTLSARRNVIPYRAEIGGIVDNLDFGVGMQACISDRNKEEKMDTNKT